MGTRWSELDVIRQISKMTGKAYPGLAVGIGDDCAIIDPNPEEHLVLTTDMLVEDVHFCRLWHPPYELGRKSVAVSISDIAAMGATPRYVFISICLPDSIDTRWLQQWLAGVESIAVEYDCCLAGGDTVRGNNITINVTIVGSVQRDMAILRSTAGVGQSVFVSGQLGSAAAGLQLFQKFYRTDFIEDPLTLPFKTRHLDPSPDIRCGALLAESGLVTSMQDISDGIATDLSHICAASGIGAIIEEALLPHHPDLPQIAGPLGSKMSDLILA